MRPGLSTSSSREDLPRTRNSSARRGYSAQDGALGIPATSFARGNGNRRRWAFRQDTQHPVTQVACAQNANTHSVRRQNWSVNEREKGQKRRRGRRSRNHTELHDVAICSEEFETTEERTEDSVPCFPGFVFDPVTRRHFRIAPDHSGITNFTPKAIARSRRERERCEQLSVGRCRIDGNSGRPSPIVPTVVSVLDRSLGVRSFNSVVRNAYEGRLLGIGSSPNAVQETPLGSSGEHVKGCQFLELVGNGEDGTLLGCWAIGDGSRNSRKAAKLACLRAHFDDKQARKATVQMDDRRLCNINAEYMGNRWPWINQSSWIWQSPLSIRM